MSKSKSFFKRLLLCFVGSLMFCILSMGMVLAADGQEQGQQKNKDVEVTISSDKKSYGEDERIKASLVMKNIGDAELTSVEIKNLIPEGFRLADKSEEQKTAEILKPGEELVLETVLEKTGTLSVVTGDNSQIWIFLLLAVGSIIMIICAVRFGRRSVVGGFLIMFCCIGAVNVQAAGEKTVLQVTTDIRVDGENVLLQGEVSYMVKESEAEIPTEDLDDNIRIALDESNLIYNEADNQYSFVDDTIPLSGTLEPVPGVETFTYTVKNDQGTIVSEGDIEIGSEWSVPDMGLFMGDNEVVLTAATSEGKNVLAIHLYNDSEEALEKTELDTETDSDGDGLPDFIEDYSGTDPQNKDTDGDGLADSVEAGIPGCSADSFDYDGNGVSDADEDCDGDGLTNQEEIQRGTDPVVSDSDNDGLKDKEEIDTYGTDPINPDTDGDGAMDGWEIDNGYDPLVSGDDFQVEQEIIMGDVSAHIDAVVDGQAVQTLGIQKTERTDILNPSIPGYLAEGVDLNVEGNLSGATLSFTFDEALLDVEGFDPVIYYYNEESGLLEPQQTIVSGNVASAALEHFSTYILLNRTEFDKVWETEIKPPEYTGEDQKDGLDVVLAIDSSGSMSSNDRQGLRREAAKRFVDKLGENDRGAIVDFDDYASVFCTMTSSKDALKAAIDKVDDNGGTNLSDPVSMAVEILSAEENNHYKFIILLTDGVGSYSSVYSQQAKDAGIVIYTIGLGNGVNESLLQEIAEDTEGKYFHATTADDLIGIYDDAAGVTIDYVTDSNADGISDYYTRLMCDGILKLGTGAGVFEGISYDKVQANADYDGDGLKNGEEVNVVRSGNLVTVKMNSDPVYKNVDEDIMNDAVESNAGTDPFKYNISDYTLDVLADDGGMAAEMSRKFMDDPWYRLQLGIGNYIFGGEYDWVYSAQQELNDFMIIYADTQEEKTRNELLDSLEENAKGTLDFLKGLYGIVKNIGALSDQYELEELRVLIEAYYEYHESITIAITDTSIQVDVLIDEFVSYKEQIVAVYNKIAAKVDLSGFPSIKKYIDNINGYTFPILKKIDKYANVVEYAMVAYDTGKSLYETIEAHSKVRASGEIYADITTMLGEVKESTENPYVKAACQNMLDSLEEQYVRFNEILADIANNGVLEIGVDAVLAHSGPVGWAVSAGRMLANLVSGVGETTAEHLHVVAMGDVIVHYAPNVRSSFDEGDYPAADDRGEARTRMEMILQMQLVGYNNLYCMSDAQSWLIKLFNNHDALVDVCQANVGFLKNIGENYSLKYTLDFEGSEIKDF